MAPSLRQRMLAEIESCARPMEMRTYALGFQARLYGPRNCVLQETNNDTTNSFDSSKLEGGVQNQPLGACKAWMIHWDHQAVTTTQ